MLWVPLKGANARGNVTWPLLPWQRYALLRRPSVGSSEGRAAVLREWIGMESVSGSTLHSETVDGGHGCPT